MIDSKNPEESKPGKIDFKLSSIGERFEYRYPLLKEKGWSNHKFDIVI